MTDQEATGALSTLGERAAQAHAGLQASGEKDDPRWVELGEALGHMYALCACNESIARTPDCETITAEIEKNFGLSK